MSPNHSEQSFSVSYCIVKDHNCATFFIYLDPKICFQQFLPGPLFYQATRPFQKNQMPTAHHTNDSAVFEHRNSMNTTNPIAVDEESPHVQGEEQQQPKSNSTFKRKLGGGLLGVFLLCGCAVGAYFQFRSTSTSTSTAADDSSNVNLHSGQAGEHKTPIHDTLSLDVISTDRVSRHHANMARCDAGFACWKNKWHNKTHVHRQLLETDPKKSNADCTPHQ